MLPNLPFEEGCAELAPEKSPTPDFANAQIRGILYVHDLTYLQPLIRLYLPIESTVFKFTTHSFSSSQTIFQIFPFLLRLVVVFLPH